MNLKKLITSAIAGCVAASCLCVPAFAAESVTITRSDGNVDVVNEGEFYTVPDTPRWADGSFWVCNSNGGFWSKGSTLPYMAVKNTAGGDSLYLAEGTSATSVTVNYVQDGNLVKSDTLAFNDADRTTTVPEGNWSIGAANVASGMTFNQVQSFWYFTEFMAGDTSNGLTLNMTSSTSGTPVDPSDPVVPPVDPGQGGSGAGEGGSGEGGSGSGQGGSGAGTEQGSGSGSAAVTPAPKAPVSEHPEIAEAIANGTWGAEYTTCEACGHHDWTRVGNMYRCDNCGHLISTVKTGANVKGYVAMATEAATKAPASQYKTAAEAQAAADAREAAYAASIKAAQDAVAAREDAYLKSLGL